MILKQRPMFGFLVEKSKMLKIMYWYLVVGTGTGISICNDENSAFLIKSNFLNFFLVFLTRISLYEPVC